MLIKTINLFLTFFLAFCSGINAQSITAGQYGTGDYYYDYNPDTVIECIDLSTYCVHMETYFDNNNDGISDFTFEMENAGGAMGSSFRYVRISSLNNSQIAFGRDDTCYGDTGTACSSSYWVYPIAKGFSDNDTVDNTDFPGDYTTQYLLYTSVTSNCIHCSQREVTTDTSFLIGTRIIVSTDTLYGWIRIKNTEAGLIDAMFTIEEYACNKGSSGVNEIPENPFIQVFPNPCKEAFTVKLPSSTEDCILIISDIQGHVLYKQDIKSAESIVETGALPGGVYFIKAISDNDILVEKLIKK